jgi:hypothetical protein
MRKLRSFGIYQPPGETRPVYVVLNGGGYTLYDSELGATIPPRFEVKPDGSVVDWHDDPASWSVEDLVDTGDSARP